eukprot:gnl/Spiro4/28775_TR14243_c0_g1_i1.p1 gnl/Spiro4/28775_TR14243_c0_g1~~gnl/Spiro4/28775_TR14243_c0_g1_i1.p1  ORF type:complete len:311 (+),score=62.15 gnl/Spiro4/28775_TR14243_c0_g1_i1:108-935(+)
MFSSNTESAVATSDSFSLGTGLWRTYTKYVTLPVTSDAARAAGWAPVDDSCTGSLGVAWAMDGKFSSESPLVLYFTPYGQITGVAVDAYVSGDATLLTESGVWNDVGSGAYRAVVSFRDSSDVCSDSALSLTLGDRVVVNQHLSNSITIPNEESEAASSGEYQKGACFASMGNHYFRDFQGGSTMQWKAATLMPVVPMYDQGVINAILFSSPFVQQGLLDAHSWEPIPLINYLMCKNFCNSDCTFSDTSIFSTLHIYFKDPKSVTCPGGCTMSCC